VFLEKSDSPAAEWGFLVNRALAYIQCFIVVSGRLYPPDHISAG